MLMGTGPGEHRVGKEEITDVYAHRAGKAQPAVKKPVRLSERDTARAGVPP
jgi:hypothetical protein